MTLNPVCLIPWRMIAIAMFLCIMAAPAVSREPCSSIDKRAVGKLRSPQRILTLYAKDPVTWKIRPGGAHGTLIYNEKTGLFSFKARKLMPLSGYMLVRNADTPPTGDLLSKGTTNKAGELRLSGRWSDWTKKFWLVSSNDLTICGNRVTLIAWNPEQYLFEEKVLGVHCGKCDE